MKRRGHPVLMTGGRALRRVWRRVTKTVDWTVFSLDDMVEPG
jgi:hypothetical protein